MRPALLSRMDPRIHSAEYVFDSSAINTQKSSGDRITEFYDLSGHANHATAMQIYGPETNVSTRNGRNVVSYDGTQYMLLPVEVDLSDFTVICAINPAEEGSNWGPFGSSDSFIFNITATSVELYIGASYVLGWLHNSKPSIYTIMNFQSIVVSGLRNGEELITVSNSFSGTTSGLQLGGILNGSGFWKSDLYGTIFIGRSTSEAERRSQETILADRWGIYHKYATWIDGYDVPMQIAIHLGKLNQDELDSAENVLGAWFAPRKLSGTGPVATLPDLSLKGNDATQGTASLQPSLDENGINGVKTLIGNDEDCLTVADSSTTQSTLDFDDEFTIVYVAEFNTLESFHAVFNFSGGTELLVSRTKDDDSLQTFLNDGTATSVSSLSTGTPYIVVIKRDSSSTLVRINGVDTTHTASATQSWTTVSLELMHRATFQKHDGQLGDSIFYKSALSSSDITDIEDYLNDIYSIF